MRVFECLIFTAPDERCEPCRGFVNQTVERVTRTKKFSRVWAIDVVAGEENRRMAEAYQVVGLPCVVFRVRTVLEIKEPLRAEQETNDPRLLIELWNDDQFSTNEIPKTRITGACHDEHLTEILVTIERWEQQMHQNTLNWTKN